MEYPQVTAPMQGLWGRKLVKQRTVMMNTQKNICVLHAPVYRAKEPGSFSAETSAGKTHAVGDFGRESFQGVGSGGCPIPLAADWKKMNIRR